MPIWSPALFGSGAASGYVVEKAIKLDGGADYLVRDPFTAGNRKTFTFSCWLKRSNLGTTGGTAGNNIFSGDRGSNFSDRLMFGNGDDGAEYLKASFHDDTFGAVQTTALYRDPTAWMNVVWVVDTDQGGSYTASDTVKIYVNGVSQTFSSASYPAEDYETAINNTENQAIGVRAGTLTQQHFGGYMAEIILLDGTAVSDASSFGELDDNGVWVPIEPSGLTFGTNGYHLKFDSSGLLGKSSNSTTTPTVSYLGSFAEGVVRQEYTVTAAALGDAASNRTIVVAVGGALNNAGARSVSSLTVAGSTATFIARKNSGGGGVTEFWSVALATGTSGNIVVGFTGGNNNMSAVGIAWWRVLDAGQPISTDSDTGSSWSTQAVTTIGQTGDVALYALFDAAGAPPNITGYSWSDATERAEHLNITSSSTTHYAFTAADYTFTSAESHTETVTIGGGSGNDDSYLGITFSNNNSYTGVSLAAANQVTDTCTDDADNDIGNYCTWSSICAFPSAKVALSDGNTTATITPDGAILATQFFDVTDSDGFYWETKIVSNASNADHVGIGQATVPLSTTGYLNNGIATYLSDGGADHTSSDRHSGNTFPTYGNGDTISVAVKGGAIWFAKNNTWINSATASEIAAGTTTNAVFTGLTGMWTPMVREHSGGATVSTTNWGASAFAYTPPTGLKRLMTADRSAPTVTDPSAYFGILTWQGNGTDDTTIRDGETVDGVAVGGALKDKGGTGTRWTPDFAWIKNREDNSTSWVVSDVVRGVTKNLATDTDADEDDATRTTNFVAGGIEVGNSNFSNKDGKKTVGYFLKAGGSPSSNANGSITSSVSVADHGGFSIGTYTGNTTTSTTKTVGHGLSRKPSWVICKMRSGSGLQTWTVWQEDIFAGNNAAYIILNLANASTSGASFSSTAPTGPTDGTGVFTVGNDATNQNGDTFVFYAFAKTPGLIASGSYTGNGSADGPFIQVNDGGSGFKPAWIMVKSTAAEGWHINDAARDPINPLNNQLQPHSSNAESGSSYMDFTANGFKLRGTQGATNATGGTYIYLAFAEHPFGGSGVAQAKVR